MTLGSDPGESVSGGTGQVPAPKPAEYDSIPDLRTQGLVNSSANPIAIDLNHFFESNLVANSSSMKSAVDTLKELLKGNDIDGGCEVRVSFAKDQSIRAVQDNQKKAFEPDGCSVPLAGRSPIIKAIGDGWWEQCCIQHDYCYFEGGQELDRMSCDEKLFECMTLRLAPGSLYFGAVRLGGFSHFNYR